MTKACHDAGLAGVSLHTLRHTFASRLVMAGVDTRTVQVLGGWLDLSSHLSPGHCTEAIERIVESFPPGFPPCQKQEPLLNLQSDW